MKSSVVEVNTDDGNTIYAPIIYDENKCVTADDIVKVLIGKEVYPSSLVVIVDIEDIPHIVFSSKIVSIKTFKGVKILNEKVL